MDTFPNTAENGGAEYVLTKKRQLRINYIRQMRINYVQWQLSCWKYRVTKILLKTSIYPGGETIL